MEIKFGIYMEQSSNEHRNLMPNYLLQWNMIKYSIEQKRICMILEE